ncbi:MAG: hypothetical protein AB7G75_37120 [Candidatus Binatia bacterium]
MQQDNVIHLSLRLPDAWWQRLRRVAGTCYASPTEFAREVLEAEIVRRELLLEKQGGVTPDWLALLTAEVVDARVQ